MAAPSLAISVEPAESGKAVYLELAPARAGQSGHAMIILRLRITNDESSAVVVSGIRFSFPGSVVPPVDMQGVAYVLDPDGKSKPLEALGTIAPGQTATWSNGRVDVDPSKAGTDMRDNMVYVDGAAPPEVLVEVFCKNFSEPASVSRDLAKWAIPEPTGSLLFPIAAGDLREGEYVVGRSWHGTNGGAPGTQIMAHDVGVQAVSGGVWSDRHPGMSGTNDSFRIWDTPIRAMADGEVESFESEMDDNVTLGDQDPTPKPKEGNHYSIRHGDVIAVYSHLRKGSQPVELLTKGATVKAGQFLGRIGNSGNSTNPHTHLELRRAGSSRSCAAWSSAMLRSSTTPRSLRPDQTIRRWRSAVRACRRRRPSSGRPRRPRIPASLRPGSPSAARGRTAAGSQRVAARSRPRRSSLSMTMADASCGSPPSSKTERDGGPASHGRVTGPTHYGRATVGRRSRQEREKLFDDEGKRLVHVHTYFDGARGAGWVSPARETGRAASGSATTRRRS